MASHLFVIEGSSSPSLDVLQTIINQPNPVDQLSSFHHVGSTVFSSSPPSNQLENLSLRQTNPFQSHPNSSFLANGYDQDFPHFDDFEVNSEQNVDSSGYNHNFIPHSSSGIENIAKYMQRSSSSICFDGKPAFGLLEPSNNLHNLSLSSPRNGSFAGHMRRVCSTGDLQSMGRNYSTQRSYSSPLATESSSILEEPNFKLRRYSAQERKERISKYRAKRMQRNFNKTIKYACRKTLADNRPRIRGRFARNDEIAETPKKIAFSSSREEEEDDFWFVDGLDEEEEGSVSSFAQRQFQFHGCF